MKNQSLIFKVLGVALLAVLAWALYDIAGQIFPVVNVAGCHGALDRAYMSMNLSIAFGA